MLSRGGGERSGAVAVFLGVVVASLVALHNSRQAKDGKNVDISSSDETCKASPCTTTGEGCSCSNNRYQHACCHTDACCEEKSDNNHNINKKNTITVNESSCGGVAGGYDSSSDSADGSDDEDSLDEYFQENATDYNIRDDFTTDDGRFKMVLLVNMKLG